MSQEPRAPLDDERLLALARVVTRFARSYNKYEVHGVEHIPAEGPALIVTYHGPLPVDAFYFSLQHYLATGRMIRGLGDDILFKLPGLRSLMRILRSVPAAPGSALALLREGHLVGVFPGGAREAIRGSAKNYQLLWNKRIGFARLALEAGVDIIPTFTENVDELYITPFSDAEIVKQFYEKTRFPAVALVGVGPLPFPVKLRSWIAPPIKIGPGETAESLAARTRESLERLISEHQRKDQTVLQAIRERFESDG